MDLYSFPSCCVVNVLADFNEDEGDSAEELDEMIEDAIEHALENTHAMVVATTTSDQEFACEALERAGFESTEWIKKPLRHEETDLKMWWKILQDQS